MSYFATYNSGNDVVAIYTADDIDQIENLVPEGLSLAEGYSEPGWKWAPVSEEFYNPVTHYINGSDEVVPFLLFTDTINFDGALALIADGTDTFTFYNVPDDTLITVSFGGVEQVVTAMTADTDFTLTCTRVGLVEVAFVHDDYVALTVILTAVAS